MRLRARHMHAIEALTDNVVGYLINLFVFWLVYNVIFGNDVPLHENAVGGLIFFVVALARKYTIRRWFNAWIGRVYERRAAEEKENEKRPVVAIG